MFTKKDLRNGDIIVRRNGTVEIAIVDLGVFVCQHSGWNDFNEVWEDLTDYTDDSQYDIMKVIRPSAKYQCRFDYRSNSGELVYDRERDTKPLYNGRVVCIDSGGVPSHLTVGKIYVFENGLSTNNLGGQITYPPVTDFNDLQSRFTAVKFIEIEE